MSSFSSADIRRALERAGFEVVSQSGSHLKLRAGQGRVVRTVILQHPRKDVTAGVLGSILRQAGLTRSEFDQLI